MATTEPAESEGAAVITTGVEAFLPEGAGVVIFGPGDGLPLASGVLPG